MSSHLTMRVHLDQILSFYLCTQEAQIPQFTTITAIPGGQNDHCSLITVCLSSMVGFCFRWGESPVGGTDCKDEAWWLPSAGLSNIWSLGQARRPPVVQIHHREFAPRSQTVAYFPVKGLPGITFDLASTIIVSSLWRTFIILSPAPSMVNWSLSKCFTGITTIRLRTFRLRHFVYRHFVYRYLVYYDFPCWNRSWSDEMKTISIEAELMQGTLPN